ncbi:unnamed protein product, partial [Rotaria magnacalcarata]
MNASITNSSINEDLVVLNHNNNSSSTSNNNNNNNNNNIDEMTTIEDAVVPNFE